MVGAGALHAVPAVLEAPPEVAASHHNAHLHTDGHTFLNDITYISDYIEIQPPAGLTGQSLPADLQQYPLILWLLHALSSFSRNGNRPLYFNINAPILQS